mmetsp:Transcript_25426/g.45969  ORF Transcript_25426/g.45969 Transcript_25426/m.45969 type:complete len:395 (+) Transcript_25426:117-1301(+)|eukprot:CAMPEP_0201638594 /NCGR_PEP_ID=MMETSP0493-20130528/16999_1 /ASSEMBLY_ACC=CAM_ASM_000838 /TAXON_ID=420259 /ORGANISM="Thalassiosira gravida, Strain GMp14c1" /LENGTH=394 /DNA_ID=CAMNT_0048111683 /DNA_START=60 /DNA_END=1244 /DNA_ORIENTATION=+
MVAHRRRISILALLLALTAAASFLLISNTNSSLDNNSVPDLDRQRRIYADKTLARFFDPKSVTPRNSNPIHVHDPVNHDSSVVRKNCQVIYVLGVEGSIHHGFMPVIKSLAEQQVDPITGTPYQVVKGHDALRAAIFGSKHNTDVPMNDPHLVQSTLDQICPSPHESWKHHVIIEGNSFPSGGADNEKLDFRVRRQWDWIDMTTNEIASSESALNHPTNLHQFYDAYGPYVDIKFIVLHRPYVETIASHLGFDRGPEGHSNVISGFMILLSQFLMGHMYSGPAVDAEDDTNNIGGAPLWTIVCADKLSLKQYDTQKKLDGAREHVLGYLANFLGWPQRSCPRCFDKWKESNKASVEERMNTKTANTLWEHAKALEGVWPPRRREDDLLEQQCRM